MARSRSNRIVLEMMKIPLLRPPAHSDSTSVENCYITPNLGRANGLKTFLFLRAATQRLGRGETEQIGTVCYRICYPTPRSGERNGRRTRQSPISADKSGCSRMERTESHGRIRKVTPFCGISSSPASSNSGPMFIGEFLADAF
jgi:hypothetical protein